MMRMGESRNSRGRVRQFGEATLTQADEGSCRTQLGSGDHVWNITNRI
jgi:hypothetical protein